MQFYLKNGIIRTLQQTLFCVSQQTEENNMDGRAFKSTFVTRWSTVPATLAGFRNLSRAECRRRGRGSARAPAAVAMLLCLGEERLSGHWLDMTGCKLRDFRLLMNLTGKFWRSAWAVAPRSAEWLSRLITTDQSKISLAFPMLRACRAEPLALLFAHERSKAYLRILSLWISLLNKDSCDTTTGAHSKELKECAFHRCVNRYLGKVVHKWHCFDFKTQVLLRLFKYLWATSDRFYRE